MSRLVKIGVFALVGLFALSAVSEAAIKRVPARLSMMEFYGGYSQPMGTIEGVMLEIDDPNFGITDKFIINNRIHDIDADDAYDASFVLGLKIGSTFAERFIGKIGFQYTHFSIKDTVPLTVDTILVVAPFDLNYHQVDVAFDLNVYAGNPLHMPINPYVGVGLQAGVIGITSRDFDTDYRGNIATSLNFGVDVKLTTSESGRTFWVLASDNRWDFFASNDRPKQLQIGAALRVFLRN